MQNYDWDVHPSCIAMVLFSTGDCLQFKIKEAGEMFMKKARLWKEDFLLSNGRFTVQLKNTISLEENQRFKAILGKKHLVLRNPRFCQVITRT